MILGSYLLVFLAAAAPGPFDQDSPFESGLGVNIHFTRAAPEELDLLAKGGFRWVRMDFAWGAVEREDGKYRYDDYDFLVSEMEKRKIRCLFILDYGHPRITQNLPPTDDPGRKAFARFAGAAAAHYRGRRVVWEIWNEPNISQFWKPKPDVAAYLALAREAVAAIKKAAPDAKVIAPATSTIDFPFLEAFLASGLLDQLDAVSVHPYRSGPPESVEADVLRLRNLIERFRPKGKEIPIVSGEWGYSSARISAEQQAEYIVRQQVFNRALGIPISIWYDWKDDGPDPKENEHRFGTVGQDLAPKPAYSTISAIARLFEGAIPRRRIDLGDPQAIAVLFRGLKPHDQAKLVYWSIEGERKVRLPICDLGLSTSPRILSVYEQSHWLNLAESLQDLAGAPVRLRAGTQAVVRKRFDNPLPIALSGNFALVLPEGIEGRIEPREFTLGPGRGMGITLVLEMKRWMDGEPKAVLVLEGLDAELGGSIRTPFAILADPGLVLKAALLDPEAPAVTLAPSGRSFEAQGAVLTAIGAAGPPAEVKVPKKIDGPVTLKLPLPPAARLPEDGISVNLTWESLVLDRTYRPVPLDPAKLKVGADGDAAVSGEARAEAAGRGIRLRYMVGKGWKFFIAGPAGALPLAAVPSWIVARAKGKGGDVLRVRIADSTGQTFQADLGAPTEEWSTLVARFEPSRVSHWGGAKDGVFHPPLSWQAILLVDSVSKEAHEGEVEIQDLQVIEGE